MTPEELKSVLQAGLLSFPLTDFDSALRFAPGPYAARLEWLQPYGASALFAAGGTGEFFSLAPREFSAVVQVALDTCRARTPIIAGAGGGTTLAIEYAQEAERLGAQGILLLPHYLTEASQQGLVAHVQAVCQSVRIGVIVYNRGACRLTPASLLTLAGRCPNLVGFKDGVGDIEAFVSIRQTLGERFAYLGGLPTAEVFAGAYQAMGCPVYSSAVFNFIPRTAMAFYAAHAAGDGATCERLLREFFLPYIALRNQGPGYAVSIVKAGAALAGHGAGPVRPPLTDLSPPEVEHLRALMTPLGAQ
ncbi:5-dehydro-4-deoxyglucarate dehydratase [Verminephrobacter aporrectodeae subsp. tuberculatae]|uniref:5-dehydro-4-deoxyglucarate dehydratase n=1 Tax=Verminephrobacter aporrectodeae TaxID=1110389 RepID=UPI0022388DEE|nr:5-dehydro-4-deoxyglucarate dehydratase [Verminephrobacter aporrectodeae]MCW5222912.1 5-dehydro-4-deoxyglucarate dehydratase [Verminephrobacter aporrectodeae subsp. tuberculatae]MCW5288376.1 5-dehydro-4-deoxyglucarate dehydratase [Verminephrobacter aporrectodeae subsp. tuberculatae]